MTNKDLSPTEHIIFFSTSEWEQGYTHCKQIYDNLTRQFPDHTFVGIPSTVIVKDMTQEEIKEIIEVLESYLDDEQSGDVHTEGTVEEQSGV